MLRHFSIPAFCLLCVFLIQSTSQLHAQRSGYVSIHSGTAIYFGDLSDNWLNNEMLPAAGIQAGKYLAPGVSLRGTLTMGTIGASDASAASQERRRRNLSFRSTVVEAQAGVVYEFLPDKSFRLRWKRDVHVSPFVFAGIGGMYMNPKAQYQGEWVALQPLGTEGQFLDNTDTEPYSRFQPVLPGGLGLSVRLPNRMAIWAEAGFRKTFTDYLDDVSTTYANKTALAEVGGPLAASLSDRSVEQFPAGAQRGNDSAKDSYAFLTVGIGYFFGR